MRTIFSGLIAVSLITLAPNAAVSAPASDEKMANEAIAPYVPSDVDKRDRLLAKHVEEIIEVAAQLPDEIRPATVFFNAGLSYRELHEVREKFGVEVIDVMLKAPQGDKGVVMSISGGMADLFAIKGSLEERLNFMVTSEQKCFAKMARYLPPDESGGMVDLATRPFLVYGARIFGSSRSLSELQLQPFVRAVMLNLRPSLITDFEAAKSYAGPHYDLMPGVHC